MGFHRRYISEQTTLHYLYKYNLDSLYGKADAIIFMDEFSSKVYKLYEKNLSEQEIITTFNLKSNTTKNEMH
jgi:hypothetical protein